MRDGVIVLAACPGFGTTAPLSGVCETQIVAGVADLRTRLALRPAFELAGRHIEVARRHALVHAAVPAMNAAARAGSASQQTVMPTGPVQRRFRRR